ncbi:MAG: LexA family protein [Methylobacter sp.]
MTDLRENLEREMERMGWNAYDLANASGIPQPTIHRILSGKHGDPRTNTVKKLAHALGLTEAELRGLGGYIDSTVVRETLPSHSNTELGPDITGRIPLISWVQAGNWAEIIDNDYPGDAEEWRLTTAKISKNAFALRIVGDSMINPNGYPSLPPGAIVIVEPHRQPQNGDIVIARLEDSKEATIKKLVIDGHQKFLKPLNPQYPIIEINGNCTICGVAIKVEMDL